MRRSIRVLCCALCASGILVSSGALGLEGVAAPDPRVSESSPNASDCVSFQNDPQEKSIAVHAENGCERALSCALSFQVRCEDNKGRVTASQPGSAHFSLSARGAANLRMSAEQCKQGWSIEDVSWTCR